MSKSGAKIIIVKRRKKAHVAHHGGSWKVAYADFVTAMMAFFMVMWILGMDENLKKSIEGYFSNPVGFKKGYSGGKNPISRGASPTTVTANQLRLVSHRTQEERFNRAGASIKSKLQEAGLTSIGANIEVVTTSAGLRIELAEGGEGETFFPVASAEMKPVMHRLLALIASELSPLNNPLVIEGHTDGRPFSGTYSNWELSADRANAARRVLEQNGVAPSRVREVRGLADRDPRLDADSYDASNRRITIVLPFSDPIMEVHALPQVTPQVAPQVTPQVTPQSAPKAAPERPATLPSPLRGG
ncbi:MAG: flagellar motor protein MotB [bacterium]